MKSKVRYIHEIKSTTREKHNFIILSASKPKIRGLHGSLPLFPVGSKHLIDRQVDTIRSVFIDYEVFLVTGFDSDNVANYVFNNHHDIRVVENHQYKNNTVLDSLKMAVNCCLDANTFIIYGDRLFNDKSIDLKTSKSLLFSHRSDKKNYDIGLSHNKDKKIVNASYGLPDVWSEIMYVQKQDFRKLKKILNRTKKSKVFNMIQLLPILFKSIDFYIHNDKNINIQTIKELIK
jgi:choline kinase